MGYKKALILNTREVKGRLDPFYYQEEFLELQRKLEKINYESISKLSIKVLDGIHKTPKYTDRGLIFLQANNIYEGFIDFTKKLKYVTTEWEDEVLRRYTPKAGDVLVTKDGTIGVSATVPNDFKAFSIFVSVLVIRPNQEFIIPEFLRIMISSPLVQKQILQSTKGAVISHLLIGEAKKLKIPLPPKEIQLQIIQIMDNAYKIKKDNESKAKELLDSIDSYLLEKLDIALPKEEKIVSFEVSSSDVFKDKLNPYFFQPSKITFFKELKYNKNIVSLKKIIKMGSYGVLPKSEDYGKDNLITFIRVTEMNKELGIDYRLAYKVPEKYLTKRSEIKKDDILLAIKGATIASSKSVSIVTDNISNTIINGSIFKIRVNEKIYANYLVHILNSNLLKIQMKYNLISNNGIDYLDKSSIYKLLIPLPPLPIQNEIASHIQRLRDEAKRLQKEAKEVLKKAKDEVEGIILNA